MAALLEPVLFVFGLVALGFVAGRTGHLKIEVGEALSAFAVGVALPLLLFRTMIEADFSSAAPLKLWSAYFSAVAVAWAVGHLLTTRLFGRDSAAGVVGGVSGAFSNLLLIGVPFMQGLFGPEGFAVLSLILAVHLPTMLLASILMFQLFGPRGEGGVRPMRAARLFLRRLFVNPLVVGILAGLLWRLTGLELPTLAARLTGALANVAGPVALFAVGMNLCRYGLSGDARAGLALTTVKLVLMPAAALVAARLVGLSPLAAEVVVCAAALPAGVNSFLIATQFGTGQALASNVMTTSTLCAAATLSGWLLLLRALHG